MIQIKNFSKTFVRGTPNQVLALNNLSLDIKAHEFIVVIGTNGSGKSTLLNAIAGGFVADSGKIFIDDMDVTRLEDYKRATYIGRVFQNPFSGTAPTMTVAENLRLASLRGTNKKFSMGLNKLEREVLQKHASDLQMGLENRMDSPMGLLSGGQRQALTLLMATLREPKILLLDEHTAALDPRSAEKVLHITDHIVNKYNLTTLMVTHDMQQAFQFGSRLVMMHFGEIVLDVSGDEKKSLTPEALLKKFADLRQHLTPI
jgi:putative ABC transport system ATP-binding protein